jgi:hypothetical protein
MNLERWDLPGSHTIKMWGILRKWGNYGFDEGESVRYLILRVPETGDSEGGSNGEMGFAGITHYKDVGNIKEVG